MIYISFVFAKTYNNSSKNKELKFVVQPIFRQMVKLAVAVNLEEIV